MSNDETADPWLEDILNNWLGLDRALRFIPSIDGQIDGQIRSLRCFASPGDFRDKLPELVSSEIHPNDSTAADAVVAWVHRNDDDQPEGDTSAYFSLDDRVTELELWLMIVERLVMLCTSSIPETARFYRDPVAVARSSGDANRSPEQVIRELWSIHTRFASLLGSRYQSKIDDFAWIRLNLDSRSVRPLTPESAPLAFDPEVRLLVMPAIQLASIADDLGYIEKKIAGIEGN